MAIIALMTALLTANYRSGADISALQRSAHKLAQDLRRAQEKAMSAQEIEGVVPQGFGIHFKSAWPDYYILFADLNGNRRRDGADQDIEIIELEQRIKILALLPSSDFSICFEPPDPTTWIAQSSSGSPAQIILSLEDGSASQSVKVNHAGLIYVE